MRLNYLYHKKHIIQHCRVTNKVKYQNTSEFLVTQGNVVCVVLAL